jgi:hypothetical protein
MKNLDTNFVMADDYDTAVTQCWRMSESQIEERQRNPNMLPEQYRAMAWVLGEKREKRHRDTLLWAKVAAGVSILGVLVAIVVALCQ